MNASTDLAPLVEEELAQAAHVVGRQVEVDLLPAPGVEILDVSGYTEHDGRAVEGGYRVSMGDLHTGEARKVVARLRVAASEAGLAHVVAVNVRYRSLPADRPASWATSLQVLAAADRAAIVDSRAVGQVSRALRGDALARGMAALAEGDAGGASAALQAGVSNLESVASRYAVQSADTDARALARSLAELGTVDAGSREGVEWRMLNHLEALGYVE